MNTYAIIVTYNPPAGFLDKLDNLRAQIDQLVIVDNGSKPEICDSFRQIASQNEEHIEFIFNKGNSGIAIALNQGFAWAIERNADFVFAFDQDSQPAPGMVATVFGTFVSHPRREQVAIVAPVVEDPTAGIVLRYVQSRGLIFYRRMHLANQVLNDISAVITSGALYNLQVYRKIGPFRDDFFMDYVDTEYCLRAKQCGYTIVVNCNAHLYHRLGNQQKRSIGLLTTFPTFHSVLRWYYISRNRVLMYELYGLRFPHWLLYELVVNSKGLIRLLFFEDQKINKLLAILLGTIDGIAQHMGPISDSRKTLIKAHQ